MSCATPSGRDTQYQLIINAVREASFHGTVVCGTYKRPSGAKPALYFYNTTPTDNPITPTGIPKIISTKTSPTTGAVVDAAPSWQHAHKTSPINGNIDERPYLAHADRFRLGSRPPPPPKSLIAKILQPAYRGWASHSRSTIVSKLDPRKFLREAGCSPTGQPIPFSFGHPKLAASPVRGSRYVLILM